MVDPITMAAVGSAVGGAMGFKGNMAAAKTARKTAEYNAKIAENEAVLLQRAKVREEAIMRANSERLVATQTVATAKSGIQLSGNPLQAMADAYFNTEKDALNIRYASEIEQVAKASEAGLARAEGAARSQALKIQAYGSLLDGGQKAATLMG